MNLLAALLVLVAPVTALHGSATVFWENDGHHDDKYGCVRVAKAMLGTVTVSDHILAVALRDDSGIPCGAKVIVQHVASGKWTVAWRLTSGPYGQNCPDGRKVSLELGEGCTWRGLIDVSPRVAERIGLDGSGKNRRGQIAVWRVR